MRSYETHKRYRVTEQDNRLLCDIAEAKLAGGQGRDAEDVRESGSIGGWLLLIAVGVAVVGLLAGCGTVAGFGQDLSEWSDGIRGSVQADAD